jgi:Na+/H+ antiporter NhaD/arsenite permease-like protein
VTVVAVGVFVVAYVVIAIERIPKAVTALAGAGVLLALSLVSADEAFYSSETGVDWNVVFLLLGMMVIVGVLRQTGVFEFLAIWATKRAKGQPLRIVIFLVLVTAVASAFLDNVTTVLLMAPVTLLVCDRLNTTPVPFLMAEVMASNIGGAGTLIGDPPNIIIGSRAGLSFNDFLINMAPIVILELIVFVAILPWLFRGSFTVSAESVADVLSLNEREAINNPKLLIKCAAVLALVFAGFLTHSLTHIEPSIIALLGAGLLVLITNLRSRDYMAAVEWETLLFFAGLFIMVGALVKSGSIERLAGLVTAATGGDALAAVMLILGGSALMSGIIDNIPYVATMTPLVQSLTQGMTDPVQSQSLWWSLALGADFGGNLTAIGASANVVVLGIARRADYPISFWEFTRKGAVVTALTIAVAAPYVWLRYFVVPGS